MRTSLSFADHLQITLHCQSARYPAGKGTVPDATGIRNTKSRRCRRCRQSLPGALYIAQRARTAAGPIASRGRGRHASASVGSNRPKYRQWPAYWRLISIRRMLNRAWQRPFAGAAPSSWKRQDFWSFLVHSAETATVIASTRPSLEPSPEAAKWSTPALCLLHQNSVAIDVLPPILRCAAAGTMTATNPIALDSRRLASLAPSLVAKSSSRTVPAFAFCHAATTILLPEEFVSIVRCAPTISSITLVLPMGGLNEPASTAPKACCCDVANSSCPDELDITNSNCACCGIYIVQHLGAG